MKSRIIKAILLAGMVLAAMISELMLGGIGWIFPVVLPVFYFITLNTSWYHAGFAAIFIGTALDLAVGRNFPVTIPALLMLILAAYRLRGAHPAELPEVFASVFGSMAAAEALYALFSHTEYGWGLVLQWIVLSLSGGVLTLLVIQIGRFIMDLLDIPDCFTPRSTIWKRRRLQNSSTRSPRS